MSLLEGANQSWGKRLNRWCDCCWCSAVDFDSYSRLLLCLLLLRKAHSLGRPVFNHRMRSPASVALLDIEGAVSQLADGGDASLCCPPGLVLPSRGRPALVSPRCYWATWSAGSVKNYPLQKRFGEINCTSVWPQAPCVVFPWGKGSLLQVDQLKQVVKPCPRTSPWVIIFRWRKLPCSPSPDCILSLPWL